VGVEECEEKESDAQDRVFWRRIHTGDTTCE